jgi:hypothetical protein
MVEERDFSSSETSTIATVQAYRLVG